MTQNLQQRITSFAKKLNNGGLQQEFLELLADASAAIASDILSAEAAKHIIQFRNDVLSNLKRMVA